jgi:hypothetical protein
MINLVKIRRSHSKVTGRPIRVEIPPPPSPGDLGGRMLIRDVYGNGVYFSALKQGQISVTIMKIGLILAITPVTRKRVMLSLYERGKFLQNGPYIRG